VRQLTLAKWLPTHRDVERAHTPEIKEGTMSDQRRFTNEDLERWTADGIITQAQLAQIRERLPAGRSVQPLLIAYYLGGATILFAYTLFMGLRWESLGGAGQAAVSLFTIGVLAGIGFLLRRNGHQLGGGVLIVAAVGIVPLATYSLERFLGIWPTGGSNPDHYSAFFWEVHPAWIAMEVVSLAVASLALWRLRFPALSLLVAMFGSFLVLDATRLFRAEPSIYSYDYSWVDPAAMTSAVFSAALVALGTWLAIRGKGAYTLWIFIIALPQLSGDLAYLSGAYSGWGLVPAVVVGLGAFVLAVLAQRHDRPVTSLWLYLLASYLVLGLLGSDALSGPAFSIQGLAYFAIALGTVIASVWLQRRTLLFVGALGCYSFVSYLAFRVFGDTLGFTYGLAIVGLTIVLSAVAYERWVKAWLHQRISGLQPATRSPLDIVYPAAG
jgi:hypothetical protein